MVGNIRYYLNTSRKNIACDSKNNPYVKLIKNNFLVSFITPYRPD